MKELIPEEIYQRTDKGIFSSPFYQSWICLLYTSDAADDLLCVDLGGRRIIKKKNRITINTCHKS